MNTVLPEDQNNIPPHDHIYTCRYENDIRQVKNDTQKIITGMYGPLDNPSKGFVHEVQSDIKSVKSDITEIKNNVSTMSKGFGKIVWLIISFIILAILKFAFLSPAVAGMLK